MAVNHLPSHLQAPILHLLPLPTIVSSLFSPLRLYMHHFKPSTANSEPESPLNTTLEDSIHMPQNHKRNRHPQGVGQPQLSPIPTTPIRPERPNDPFSVPMWDDASGAIHDVPSSQRQPPGTEFDESIAPIPRGLNEPSGYNSHPSPRRSEGSRRPPPLVRDWRPLRDQLPDRGVVATTQVPPALGEKDANKKLGTAASTFETMKIPYSKIHERSAQVSVSPKNESKAPFTFKTPPTEPKAMRRPPSEDIQDASPLKAFKKRSSTHARPSSPTLDRVRRMRTEEQEKLIAKLTKEIKRPSKVVFEGKGIRNLADAAAKRQSQDNDARFAAKVQELIPEIDFSISEWATPFYGLADAPRKEEAVKVEAVKSTRPAEAEAVPLSESVADHHLFEEICLAPTVPTNSALDQKSATVHKSAEKELIAAPEKKKKLVTPVAIPKSKAQLRSKASKHVLAGKEGGGTPKASASEEEFERVATPDSGEMDQNGVKRKWYKGFLR